jgi:hypothetical protein
VDKPENPKMFECWISDDGEDLYYWDGDDWVLYTDIPEWPGI